MRQQSTAMRASATKNRYIDLANNTRDALLCNEPLYSGWSVDIMRYATLNIVNIWLYAVSENGFPKNTVYQWSIILFPMNIVILGIPLVLD